MFSQDDFIALSDALLAAPFTDDGWDQALALIVKAAGASSCHLLGFHPAHGPAFSIIHGHDAETMAVFARMSGYIPHTNPRLVPTARMPLFSTISEPDFVTPEEVAKSPFYQELLRPTESELSCISRLRPSSEVTVGIAALRSQKHGYFTQDQRDTFAATLPKLDAALRMHMAVESGGARFAVQSFDSIAMPAFLFDVWGKVLAATGEAHKLLSQKGYLILRQGRLAATDGRSDKLLQAAILRACNAGLEKAPAATRVVLRMRDAVRAAEITPLPAKRFTLRAGAVAIMVLPRERELDSLEIMLKEAFGLSDAEAAITLEIAGGRDLGEIGQARNVSIHTLRSQLKNVFAKTGARSQVHLVSLVLRLSRL